MKKLTTALTLLSLATGGCHSLDHGSIKSTSHEPRNIRLESAPSLIPKCELMPLPEYAPSRRYFTFDLNSDGIPEWFIENYAGANTMSFALVDSSGNLLIRDCDIDYIGGHRILILNNQHGGYRDIITSDFYPNDILTRCWKYDGTHYVRGEISLMAFEDWQDQSKIPGLSVAAWNSFGRMPD